jgi:protein-S-isoprenylcysteine O-methyltransferase Ste14
MRMSLFWRALAAFLVFPAMVAGVIPWLFIRDRDAHLQPIGLPIIALGACLLLWCVRDFYVAGKGTLAPWDPPKRLVSIGLYRYTRNPMYVAVLVILAGWALTLGIATSRTPVAYALFMAVVFHIRVVAFEEPTLARLYGDEWQRYKSAVPRWLVRLPR